MSRAQGQAREAALPALLELVRLKGIKDEAEALARAGWPRADDMTKYSALTAEYEAKKAAAWDAAKAVFAQCAQCHRRWDHDCYHVICGRVKERR